MKVKSAVYYHSIFLIIIMTCLTFLAVTEFILIVCTYSAQLSVPTLIFQIQTLSAVALAFSSNKH